MKRALVALMALVMVVAFAGCSAQKKEVDIQAIMKTIRSEIDLPDMADIPKDRLSGYYEINTDDIANMAYIIAGSGATTDEIFIVEMVDEAKVADVKTMMEDRKKQISDLFEAYNPDEMPKVESCVIETKGKYAFFAICNDNAKAKKIFTDSF
ncbi:MAG: DUF4358 domain-containing protein [Oscillospiraceae bacterium]